LYPAIRSLSDRLFMAIFGTWRRGGLNRYPSVCALVGKTRWLPGAFRSAVDEPVIQYKATAAPAAIMASVISAERPGRCVSSTLVTNRPIATKAPAVR